MGNKSAPVYDPSIWSGKTFGRFRNNCYEYALQNNDFMINEPGTSLGHSGWQGQDIDSFDSALKHFKEMAIADGLKPLNKDNPTPDGFYRVAMYLSINRDPADRDRQNTIGTQFHDYHWVREDADGGLSHKLGMNEPERLAKAIDDGFPDKVESLNGTYLYAAEFIVPEGGIDVGIDAFLKKLSEEDKKNVCQIGDKFKQLTHMNTIASVLLNDPPEGESLTEFLKQYNNCPNSSPNIKF